MSNTVTVSPKLPPAVAKLMALAQSKQTGVTTELTGGVVAGFPILSIKGKVWRVRQGGEETMHVDGDGNALPTIDVVLVQANPTLSKLYYDQAYVEGSTESPTCFSNDGVKPDVSVQEPQNSVCASCPMNAWGSRITPDGKKARACQDSRRVAVVFAQELADLGDGATKLLLRVPPASLNPLKDYAEKVLAPKGIPFFAIVTRIGFDVNAAHPQLTFKGLKFVTDAQADAIASMRDGDEIRRILAEAQEFPAAGAAEPATGVGATSAAAAPATGKATATTPAAGKPATKPATKPAKAVSDEEAGLDAILGTGAETTEAAEEETPEPTPAPTKPQAATKPAAAAKPAATKPAKPAKAQPAAPVVQEETAEPEAGSNFDTLLDSILNG